MSFLETKTSLPYYVSLGFVGATIVKKGFYSEKSSVCFVCGMFAKHLFKRLCFVLDDHFY